MFLGDFIDTCNAKNFCLIFATFFYCFVACSQTRVASALLVPTPLCKFSFPRLKMTSAKVVETSVNSNKNSPQDYTNLDDLHFCNSDRLYSAKSLSDFIKILEYVF